MKIRATVKHLEVYKKGYNAWEKSGNVMINPDFVVSQQPFDWKDCDGNTVHGIAVKTSLGDVFYTLSSNYV